MAPHHIAERGGLVRPAITAGIVIADIEWRMVDEQQSRPLGLRGERIVEPGCPRRTKDAHALARAHGIDGDKAKGVTLDGVMQKFALLGKVGPLGERLAQDGIVFSIAGNEIERRFERREQRVQAGIFGRLAILHRVAGKDHRIRLLNVDIGNGAHQTRRPHLRRRVIGIRREDVGIADMGDQHGIENRPGHRIFKRRPLPESVNDVIDGRLLEFPLSTVTVVARKREAVPILIV